MSIEDEIAALSSRVREEAGVGAQRRFAEPLRREVVAVMNRAVAAGYSVTWASRALAIPLKRVQLWRSETEKAAVRMKRVVAKGAPREAARGIRVVLATGIVLEGLNVGQAVELCRALR